MKKPLRHAFSLIEVVIALGIFAFCAIAIFSLLPVAMNSVQSVYNESNANNIAESLAGIWEVVPTNNTNIINSNFPLTNFTIGALTDSTNYFFDEFGRQTTLADAVLAMRYSATTSDPPLTNSFSVTMDFYWPAATINNANAKPGRSFNYIFTK